jgi:hypothetical protein
MSEVMEPEIFDPCPSARGNEAISNRSVGEIIKNPNLFCEIQFIDLSRLIGKAILPMRGF